MRMKNKTFLFLKGILLLLWIKIKNKYKIICIQWSNKFLLKLECKNLRKLYKNDIKDK